MKGEMPTRCRVLACRIGAIWVETEGLSGNSVGKVFLRSAGGGKKYPLLAARTAVDVLEADAGGDDMRSVRNLMVAEPEDRPGIGKKRMLVGPERSSGG